MGREGAGEDSSGGRRAVRPKCNPAVFMAVAGSVSDRELAARHGLTSAQVAYARRNAGVAAHRRDWNAMAGELGHAPDSVIAARHGVNNKVVALARWRLGIPKWQEVRTCPCGESFIAFHGRQRFHADRCQRYYWQLTHKHGMNPNAADCAIAVWALKKTLKSNAKGLSNVD